MFKIDPDTIYSLDEIGKLLDGIVSLPTFMDRLALRDVRVFRDAVFGWEILRASQNAESFSSKEQDFNKNSISSLVKTRSRKMKPADSPAGKLSPHNF